MQEGGLEQKLIMDILEEEKVRSAFCLTVVSLGCGGYSKKQQGVINTD